MTDKDKEVINSDEVGSLEDVLGKEDSLFTGNEENIDTVDLTGSQAVEEDITPEDFGKVEAEGENTVTENMKDVDPEAGTQDDPANDHRLSTVKPKKDIPVETPIEYLFNPNNKKVFPVNKDIVRQKGLIPCTKEGKILPDFRRPSDFR